MRLTDKWYIEVHKAEQVGVAWRYEFTLRTWDERERYYV